MDGERPTLTQSYQRRTAVLVRTAQIWRYSIFDLRWGCTLGISQLLLDEQLAAMVRKTFARLYLMCQFSGMGGLQKVMNALVISQLVYCPRCGAALKNTQKLQLVQNSVRWAVMGI